MATPTPQQVRTRERFEALIGLAAPVLNLVLSAGERLSRVAGPEDEYYPIRPPGEAFVLSPVARPETEGAPESTSAGPGRDRPEPLA